MTKKETTTPVVKEEKAKVKRVRKPKTTPEVVKDPQTDIPVSMDLDENPQVNSIDPKVVELEDQVNTLKDEKETLLTQVEDKTKAYDNLRTTYNKLLEDYKIEKNKSKQVSKALEDAKARATEYKSSWNAAKAARDQFASDLSALRTKYDCLDDSYKTLEDNYTGLVTDNKQVRMLALIFGIAFGASIIAMAIITHLYC